MRRGISYPSKPHSSGQARIKIGGKELYLGKFGTPESKVRFYRLMAEYNASGVLPCTDAAPADRTKPTVAELVASFWIWASGRYVKHGRPTSEISLYRTALAPVVDIYGDMPADDFGPKALTACRGELVRAGYCREKINQHVGRIRRVWKWGVSQELVSVTAWQALTAVEGLKKGEAHDNPPVARVALERVQAVKDRVLPPVWAMVELQLWTAMRPGEVVQMRTCDIQQDDQTLPAAVASLCWVYRPASHKTEHHQRQRIILIGPQAQEILRPWLRPDNLEAPLFSPREAVAYRRALQRAKSGRPPSAAKPKRTARDRYRVRAYARAIERGCEAAFGMPKELRTIKKTAKQRDQLLKAAREWRAEHCWTPNQLRHNAATLIRKHFGAEVARVILGHASLNTTEIYAEADLEKAAKAMAAIG